MKNCHQLPVSQALVAKAYGSCLTIALEFSGIPLWKADNFKTLIGIPEKEILLTKLFLPLKNIQYAEAQMN
jgi:hypothetical protein